MAVSKVVKSNGDVIMDISQDNVNANNLLQGGTAHGSDGEAVQGAVIVAPTDVTETSDTTPYLYKASEHDAVYDELVGGSVAWNQLAKPISSWGYANIDISTSSNGVMTINGTASGTTYPVLNDTEYSVIGHKYLMTLHRTDLTTSITLQGAGLNMSNGTKIQNATDSGKWYIRIMRGTVCDNIKVTPQIIDLTQMFGTTIADYAYNLEQSTAGSGIAWLKSYGFFTEDYYPYNAGGLISVNTSGKKVVSETTEITYPIQSTDLRGLYKLNGNKLYTDGDIYSADGIVTRKYGIVDLGTLNWQLTSGVFTPTTDIGAKVQSIQGTLANILCPKYVTIQQNQISGKDKVIFGLNWGTGVGIIDSFYTNATTFKTAMSGVYLIYELATPTTVTASPFTSPQMVYRNGTEEYLDARDVPLPVGGNRKYVDIPDWMVNEYFDDVRAETSTLKTISKLQQENEILRNALSQSTYLIPEGTIDIDSNTITDRTKCYYYIPNNPNNSMTIDENAFKGCANLINITLPVNVSSIEYAAFSGCKSLTNINLTNVAHIRDVAFFNCKGLTSITIPSSVISISDNAFRGCTNLTNITINKPQNSISGAPWEATNATVTWTG